MITNAKLKLIRSLAQKKYREQYQLFVVEGRKSIAEFEKRWQAVERYSGEDARRASFLQHPQGELALFATTIFTDLVPQSPLRLALDGVQDPGNLGTIIRVADWFGIDHILCSEDCADVLNPKVVQATMGSLARVKIDYVDLRATLGHATCPVYGTLLDGESIYSVPLAREGIIVMGNEGNGISPAVRECLTHKLLIPRQQHGDGPESLNVAIATAITLSEFCRPEPSTLSEPCRPEALTK